MRATLFSLFILITTSMLAVESATNQFLPVIPEGYYLQAYDNCGVDGRQPHVLMKDCYLWTFATSDTDAGLKERSAVFSYKGIQAVYAGLDPKLSYILALTYASDHVYNRVQSLEANGVVLHRLTLAQGQSHRVIVKVPPEVTRDGKIDLSWKIHGEVNSTVSIIELWANALGTNALKITSIAGLPTSLQGQVFDQAYDAVAGAQISLSAPGGTASGGHKHRPGGNLQAQAKPGAIAGSRRRSDSDRAAGRAGRPRAPEHHESLFRACALPPPARKDRRTG